MMVLAATCISSAAVADPYGQCLHQQDQDRKRDACVEASRSTPYPWVLQWVYRELARIHRDRSDLLQAVQYYEQSLAAEPHESVRHELGFVLLSLRCIQLHRRESASDDIRGVTRNLR